MKKQVLSMVILSFIFLSSTLFLSCSAYVAAKFEDPGPNPSFNYRFDYTPQAGKKLTEPLTMLLLSPSYNVVYPQVSGSNVYAYNLDVTSSFDGIIKNYTNAMGDDFKEMMTSRNFRIIEMVKNKEMATFSQRDQSNFSLTATVTLEFTDQITNSEKPSKDIGAILLTNNYSPGTQSGIFGVKSRIKLEVYEPLTWQLLWTKSLETDPLSENYTFKYNYVSVNDANLYKVGSDTRPMSLAKLLEQSYKNVMDNLMTYIDPDEFAILSKQAKEIRKQATGIVR